MLVTPTHTMHACAGWFNLEIFVWEGGVKSTFIVSLYNNINMCLKSTVQFLFVKSLSTKDIVQCQNGCRKVVNKVVTKILYFLLNFNML